MSFWNKTHRNCGEVVCSIWAEISVSGCLKLVDSMQHTCSIELSKTMNNQLSNLNCSVINILVYKCFDIKRKIFISFLINFNRLFYFLFASYKNTQISPYFDVETQFKSICTLFTVFFILMLKHFAWEICVFQNKMLFKLRKTAGSMAFLP